MALERRRLFGLNLAVPLLLVALLVAGAAPAHHSAAIAAVLFVVFGVFGSAIPLVRDAESGLLVRWLVAGVAPRRYLAGRLGAQALLDLLQLLPAALLGAVAGASPAATIVPLLAALSLALLVANALGAWVAAAARSLAESALFGAVAALLLLHLGGVFRTPAPGSWQAGVEALIPFRPLHEALLSAFGAGASAGAGPEPALAASAAFLLLTGAVAPWLLARLSDPAEGPV